ncbi:MAG TPA: hypothetical protein VNW99_03345 [Cytophagaceae bacterium]|jgi:hypothetical protein|nr:hypothetical protein [Cytophagaceae bacterium]
MKNTLKLFACLFFFLITPSLKASAEDLVFQGTIGKYPVILMITKYEDGKVSELQYYYKSSNVTIYLTVITDSNEIIARNYRDYANTQIDEEFKLQPHKTGYRGTWKQEGKVLQVNLIRAYEKNFVTAFDYLPFVKNYKTDNLFEYVKLTTVTLKASDTLNKIRDYEYFIKVLKCNKAEITSFKICPNNSVQYIQINDTLLNSYLSEILRFWAESKYGRQCAHGSTKEVLLLNNHFFSYSNNWFVNCDVPYGNLDLYNFELPSGKEILFKDIINNGIEINENSNVPVMGERVLKMLMKANTFADADSTYDDNYNYYFKPESWNAGYFNLSEEGIYFYMRLAERSDLTYVGDKFLVPYEIITPYLTESLREKTSLLIKK